MKELACNLRFLKMVFRGGSWLKLSAVYCFVGFVIASSGQWVYIEEAVAESLSSFVLTISVLPSVILLYYPVLRICQNSAAVVSEGKGAYVGRVRNLLWMVSGIFVLYYGAGAYLLSKFVFSDGNWYNRGENLKVWLLKLLLLLLFLLVVSLVYCFCMVRNVNSAAAAVVVLVGTFLFWSRIDIGGYNHWHYSLLFGALLLLLLGETYLLKRRDFMYWR